MRYLIAALAAVSFAASASQTARQGEDWVRTFDSPCVSVETLNRIPAAMRGQFRKAQAGFQGQLYFGCYIIRNGAAYVIYEDGDEGIIQLGEFKDDLDV